MKFSIVALFAATAAAMVAPMATPAFADLLAYEGFDGGTIGQDAANTAATGVGFEDLNSTTTDFRFDTEAGLSYLNLEVTGNSAGMDVSTGGTQNLQLAFTNTGANAIPTTGTIYSSYLMDVNGVNSWGLISGMLNASVGRAASTGAAEEAVFRATSSNWGVYGVGGINLRTGPASAPDATGSFFLVNEYNLDTGTMTTYGNPTDLTDVTGTAAFTISDTATSNSFSNFTNFNFGISGGAASTGFIDEVRVGNTIADVTPIASSVPEPSSLALLGLCGLGVLTRRRR